MVDPTLLEQVLQLDDSARRELRAVIDDSLDDGYVSPEIAAIIDARLAELGPEPSPDSISLDEFMAQVRARRIA